MCSEILPVIGIMTAPMVLLGVHTMFTGLYCAVFGVVSRNWPCVKGWVTASEVRTKDSVPGPMHSARISYAYLVGRRLYRAKRYAFCANAADELDSPDPGEAGYIANQHPRGEHIDVYYWPIAPRIAVLLPGFHAKAIMMFMIGALVAGIPLGVITLACF